MKTPILPVRMIVTGAIVILALIAGFILYQRYVSHPWTRDGQVSADITLVTPQVSGWVVKVAVEDGQTVKAGDLLFEIDPESYRLAVQSATVQLASARQQVASLEANVVVAQANVNSAKTGIETAKGKIEASKAQVDASKGILASATADVTSAEAAVAKSQADLENAITQRDRALRLAKDGAGSVANAESKTAQAKSAQATLDSAKASVISSHGARDKAVAGLAQAQANLAVSENGLPTAQAQLESAIASLAKARADLGDPGDANVQVRAAMTGLARSELDLSWTRVTAPADGYVTNLVVKAGDYTSVGKPMLAFVFGGSFYVQGYFRETQLKNIAIGDTAAITLMSHKDEPLEGVVETIGFAINPPNIAQTGAAGDQTLVPVVQPSFDWIRLAQRVPVRIRLTKVPEGVRLVAGLTTSVAIRPE